LAPVRRNWRLRRKQQIKDSKLANEYKNGVKKNGGKNCKFVSDEKK